MNVPFAKGSSFRYIAIPGTLALWTRKILPRSRNPRKSLCPSKPGTGRGVESLGVEKLRHLELPPPQQSLVTPAHDTTTEIGNVTGCEAEATSNNKTSHRLPVEDLDMCGAASLSVNTELPTADHEDQYDQISDVSLM